MTRVPHCFVRVCLAALGTFCAIGFGLAPRSSTLIPTKRQYSSLRTTASVMYQFSHNVPEIWVEEAEDDFVDEDENLEEGEVCHRSVKAFASSPGKSSSAKLMTPRFLGAGALVQRPGDSLVCDAWTGDAILEEGGPNLQVPGACMILDDLLLFHLQRQHGDDNADSILGLQTFVVKCGDMESEYSCASYMAAMCRGFQPLKDAVRENTIYSSSLYDKDLDGFVIDAVKARNVYEKLSERGKFDSTASKISRFLPDDDTIRRHTIKRFTVQKPPGRKRMDDDVSFLA